MSTGTEAHLGSGTAVEIRCHADCPWLPGFAVLGTAVLDGGPAYRVRHRRSAHTPAITVPAGDVRPAPAGGT